MMLRVEALMFKSSSQPRLPRKWVPLSVVVPLSLYPPPTRAAVGFLTTAREAIPKTALLPVLDIDHVLAVSGRK